MTPPYRIMSRLKRDAERRWQYAGHGRGRLTNSFAKATYRQRITHFTEELSFLSDSDKDWIMGRAILARLKWA